MGKAEFVWSVPVIEAQQFTPTIFEKRFSYYGVVFPSLCCVCGENPGTVAHEVQVMLGTDRTATLNVPWCQRCAGEYAALEKGSDKALGNIKPIRQRWLGIAFLFGIVWWLGFGAIQPGILPAIGALIWMGSIVILIIEFVLSYIPFRKQLQRYENAVKIKSLGKVGIIHRETRLQVAFKNEKYSEAFGKANPSATALGAPEQSG